MASATTARGKPAAYDLMRSRQLGTAIVDDDFADTNDRVEVAPP